MRLGAVGMLQDGWMGLVQVKQYPASIGESVVCRPLAKHLVVSDGRKYITGLYKCQCAESLDSLIHKYAIFVVFWLDMPVHERFFIRR